MLYEVITFPHAEERRLFYVALTRAKHKVFLVTDMLKASEFIKELIDGDYPLELEEFGCSDIQKNAHALTCSTCKTGTLVLRESNRGNFMGCSNYPICRITSYNVCYTKLLRKWHIPNVV